MDLLGSSAIVETAIGLALVFFLGAGLCTAVVEAVAALGQFRAKLLWRCVARWFSTADDADARRAISRAASLFKTDVGAAFKSVKAASAEQAARDLEAAAGMPSPPPPAADPAGEDDDEALTPEQAAARARDQAEAARAAETSTERVTLAARRERWDGRPPDITTSAHSPARAEFFAALPGVVDAEESLRKTRSINREAALAALTSVFATTGEVLTDARAQALLGKAINRLPDSIREDVAERTRWLERWFDAEMERLAQAYRSRIRWFAGAVALVLVLVVGLDAVQLTTELYRDPTRRQVVVAAAERRVAEGDVACPPDEGSTTTTTATTTTTTTTAATEPGGATPLAVAQERLRCAQRLVGDIDALAVSRWQDRPGHPGGLPDSVLGWLSMIAGLAVSVAALTAGAPWWFSVLKRLMEARRALTGKS